MDLNPPILDFLIVFDRSVPALPCCSSCGARYLRRSSRDAALPAPLGYLSSILHRLGYVGKVRRWLAENAETAGTNEVVPPDILGDRLGRARRAIGHSLAVIGAGIVLNVLASRRGTGPWWMEAVYGTVILAGSIGLLAGLARWLKWTLKL